MTIQLKGGRATEDPRLDRVYHQDLRSLNFLARRQLPVKAGAISGPRSFTWSVGQWLDQGQEGACVGFGFSHDLVARPVTVAGVNNSFARQRVYWEAQKIDDDPGGSYPGATPVYEGTSVLAGAKVLTSFGYYLGYDWGISAQEVATCIGHLGPAVLGINWWTGMYDPDADGFLNPTGKVEGGHCILAYSVKIYFKGLLGWAFRDWSHVDADKSYVRVWNSWGEGWGEDGTAKIRLSALKQLIEGEKGEAVFPRRNTNKTTV